MYKIFKEKKIPHWHSSLLTEWENQSENLKRRQTMVSQRPSRKLVFTGNNTGATYSITQTYEQMDFGKSYERIL